MLVKFDFVVADKSSVRYTVAIKYMSQAMERRPQRPLSLQGRPRILFSISGINTHKTQLVAKLAGMAEPG
jgi:hypothetical protein